MEESSDNLTKADEQQHNIPDSDTRTTSQQEKQEILLSSPRSNSPTSCLHCRDYFKSGIFPIFLCLILFMSEMTKWFQSPIFDSFKRHHKTSPETSGSQQHEVNHNNNIAEKSFPSSPSKMKQKGASNLCCPKNKNLLRQNSRVLTTFINKCMISPEFLPTSCTSRRLLVLINPASGPGKAGSIFREYVSPLLTEAGISDVTLFVTSSNGSATDFIREQDLTHKFDGIVVISGDGLIFEVVNGIMKRPDRQEVVRQIPLGIIPGGSGNGLAFSVLHANGDAYSHSNPILTSTLNIIHGKRSPLDLIQVETPSSLYYSFLSIGWGLLADMDIESERLRFLGGFRFSVWGLLRSLVLRKYRGRLSYLPFPGWRMNRNPFNGTTSVVSRDDKSDIKSEKIPSLDQPIPNNWVSIEDDFIMVYSGHVSHMAANCFLAPNSRLDDGVIWLLYLRGNLSRSQVIQFLIALDTGKHCDLPYVIMTPVQAFRLEPLNPSSLGVMTVDGELIPSGPLQATVLPSMLNVMTR